MKGGSQFELLPPLLAHSGHAICYSETTIKGNGNCRHSTSDLNSTVQHNLPQYFQFFKFNREKLTLQISATGTGIVPGKCKQFYTVLRVPVMNGVHKFNNRIRGRGIEQQCCGSGSARILSFAGSRSVTRGF
jgi:hypothetical protein